MSSWEWGVEGVVLSYTGLPFLRSGIACKSQDMFLDLCKHGLLTFLDLSRYVYWPRSNNVSWLCFSKAIFVHCRTELRLGSVPPPRPPPSVPEVGGLFIINCSLELFNRTTKCTPPAPCGPFLGPRACEQNNPPASFAGLAPSQGLSEAASPCAMIPPRLLGGPALWGLLPPARPSPVGGYLAHVLFIKYFIYNNEIGSHCSCFEKFWATSFYYHCSFHLQG